MIEQLRTLFASVAAKLPPEAARANEIRTDDATIIELIPSAPGAAKVGIHVDQSGLIDFYFGSGATWELPYEGRDPNNANPEAMVAEAAEMLSAVVSGRCAEKRSLYGRTGIIYVGGERYRVVDIFTQWTLFPRTIHYRPYVEQW